jgi:hypothetical protein
MFRVLHAPPVLQILIDGEVGDGPVVAACHAEDLAITFGNQPIACVVLGIGAKQIGIDLAARLPAVCRLVNIRQKGVTRDEAKAMTAIHALPVMKMQDLAAFLTAEQFHD